VSINSVLSDAKAHYGLDVSGSIELKLNYITATGALDILINKCVNLAKAKRNQTSDPYVINEVFSVRQHRDLSLAMSKSIFYPIDRRTANERPP
jgi:hypothetical protein